MEENNTTPQNETTPNSNAETSVNSVNSQSTAYVVDAPVRSVPVEYPEAKMTFVHDFQRIEERELIHYYLAAPSYSVINKDGERKPLGAPQAPSAELHNLTCKALRKLNSKGDVVQEFEQTKIRALRQNPKAEGVLAYLGSYYDVKLEAETGNMDDVLFGLCDRIIATVKVRPLGKVEQTFKLFLNVPDDLTYSRFQSQASSFASVDPDRDQTLEEFLGSETLEEITGGEDEGDRVSFGKTTMIVRVFFDIFRKTFAGGENIVCGGKPYTDINHNEFVKNFDPVLMLQVANALRNFM